MMGSELDRMIADYDPLGDQLNTWATFDGVEKWRKACIEEAKLMIHNLELDAEYDDDEERRPEVYYATFGALARLRVMISRYGFGRHPRVENWYDGTGDPPTMEEMREEYRQMSGGKEMPIAPGNVL